jgi:tRNA (mo5U34)-methyltransferase
MTVDLRSQILAIDDWRHPYEIDGQSVTLTRPFYAKWHPWRWSVDLPILGEALGSFEGRTLLDVACNDGWYGFQAEKEGAIVTGIDGRAPAIEKANLLKRAMERKNISFRLGDIEQANALGGPYDATLFYGILYHLADPIRVLARMGQATSRIIAVQTFSHASDTEPCLHLCREDVQKPGAALHHLVGRPSQSAIVMMLNAAGFEHVYRAQPADILIPPGSNRNWRWSFFYGVKGNPLRSMSAIDEETPPLKVDA